jgi:hypothetical protein
MTSTIGNYGEEIVLIDSQTERAFSECNSATVPSSLRACRAVDFGDPSDDPARCAYGVARQDAAEDAFLQRRVALLENAQVSNSRALWAQRPSFTYRDDTIQGELAK